MKKSYDYKMVCGCYLANKGFKIGRKWVKIIDIINSKVIKKCELTDDVKRKLAEVKANHPYEDDAIRVDAVEDIVDEANGLLLWDETDDELEEC